MDTPSVPDHPPTSSSVIAVSIATTSKPSVRPQGLLYAVDEWPPTAAINLLRNTARGWKVPAETIATATAQTEEILAFFAKVHPLDAGGELQISFNGLDLGISVVCHGGHRPALPETTFTPALPQSEIENEEAAAVLGLKDFLRSLRADRKSVEQRVGSVRISLLYAV